MKIGPVIHPKSGGNRFCGPSALSMILRIDTGETAALLRKVSGKRAITGTHNSYMKAALREKGYRATDLIIAGKPTLAEWLKRNTVAQRGTNVYLITTANHYVVVQGRSGGCNHGGPGPLREMKRRRGRVTSVILVEPPTQEAKAKIAHVARLKPFASMDAARANLDKLLAEKKALDQKIADATKRITITREHLASEAQRKRRSSVATARRKALALAKAHGIEIEIDRVDRETTHYWVTGPASVYPHDIDDPWDGDHIATEWEGALGVLGRVEAYVADIQKKAAV